MARIAAVYYANQAAHCTRGYTRLAGSKGRILSGMCRSVGVDIVRGVRGMTVLPKGWHRMLLLLGAPLLISRTSWRMARHGLALRVRVLSGGLLW